MINKLLYQILASTLHGKIFKKLYKSNKFKISAPTWYEEFEWTDGSYFVSDIQDFFEYIIRKYETVTDNPPIRIYVKIIENRMTFKIKTRYYVKLLTHGTMKSLGSIKN